MRASDVGKTSFARARHKCLSNHHGMRRWWRRCGRRYDYTWCRWSVALSAAQRHAASHLGFWSMGQRKLVLRRDVDMRGAVIALALVGVMSVGMNSSATGGPVTIPKTFSAGTPAKAADVNANFTAVATSVNGSAQDISTLQSTTSTLQSAVST